MSSWNSLEIAKLAASLLTPILLFVLGLLVGRVGRRLENAQWADRRLVDRRLDLHKQLSPNLNDIFCFMVGVGHFRSISPPELISIKGAADRIFFANEHLFGGTFRALYRRFMSDCFRAGPASGSGSRIRRSAEEVEQSFGPAVCWENAWDDLFDSSDLHESHVHVANYEALMEEFALEVGVGRADFA